MKPLERFKEHVESTNCKLCKEAHDRGVIFLECPACGWRYEDEEIASGEPEPGVILGELNLMYRSLGWSFKFAKDLSKENIKVFRVGVPLTQAKILLAFVGYGDRFFSAAIAANDNKEEGQRMAGSVAEDKSFAAAVKCFNNSLLEVVELEDDKISTNFDDDPKVKEWFDAI